MATATTPELEPGDPGYEPSGLAIFCGIIFDAIFQFPLAVWFCYLARTILTAHVSVILWWIGMTILVTGSRRVAKDKDLSGKIVYYYLLTMLGSQLMVWFFGK